MVDRTRTPAAPPASAGFSLIEGLVAAALLLLVAIGVLPMFAQAIRSNATGQTTTMATNAVRSSFEDYLARGFNDPGLTVPNAANQRLRTEYWVNATDSSRRPFWIAGTGSAGDQAPAGWLATWRRTATVRQFQVASFEVTSDPLALIPMTADTPLAGGVDPSFVQFKEVEVELNNLSVDLETGTASPVAGSWGQRVRILKAF